MDADTAAAPDAAPSWTVVTQVKSYRVVYFTDDPAYEPPMGGDWYYVSPFRGPLPGGMTLRNCWRWRFNGMRFTDAGAAKTVDPDASLLRTNKQALLDLLHRRIDALRRPYEPSSLAGAELRARKLAEAKAVLQRGGDELDSRGAPGLRAPLLADAAAAHRCSVDEMARRVMALDARRGALLIDTERQREEIAVAVGHATTQTELQGLRRRIVEELDADAAVPPPVRAENTTPARSKTVDSAQLELERVRLRIELRHRINELRRPLVSQYALDDRVLARKVELATAFQRAGGALPPGLDGSLLISHAAARGQRLVEAADDVLAEIREIRAVLSTTEQMKDATLSRIAGVATLEEAEAISRAIQRLKIEPEAAPSPIDSGA